MATPSEAPRPARLPPRWFIRLFWRAQRTLYRVTRRSLQKANSTREGMLALHSVGRRSGAERTAILGYFEDGPDLVTMAMNGWGEAEPAWWLNVQANPDVTVDLVGERRLVRARAAVGDERRRLWARWAEYNKGLDQYAARRSHETAVVIFEPRPSAGA